MFFVLVYFFLIPYFTSFIQPLTWQNASCMYYSLWGSKVYKEKRNVPRTLVIQRYASTNLPRPPLLWSKKMMVKALIVLFLCQHPTYLLMNNPIYHFHLPLSQSFQKVLLKILHNHLWAKVPNIAWGAIHQVGMYTYALVVPHSSMVVHTFYEHHFLANNHESFYPTFNLPCG